MVCRLSQGSIQRMSAGIRLLERIKDNNQDPNWMLNTYAIIVATRERSQR